MKKKISNFYLKQGPHTLVSDDFVRQFPNDISEIVRRVQNILIHKGRAIREKSFQKNSDDPAFELKTNLQIIHKAEKLDTSQKISLQKKIVSICRNYAMLLVAVLREKGFPARARCGFAIYFKGGFYEDHWICEYYSGEKSEWVQVDAQMDEYWRKVLNLNEGEFNPLDLKRGQFLYGANIWKLYRQNVINPNICGMYRKKIFGEHYIRGNMMRDFFALNKVEYLYNEYLPFMERDERLSQKDLETLDYIAEITHKATEYFQEILQTCEQLNTPEN